MRINACRHDFATVVDENFNRGLVEEDTELENTVEGLQNDFANAFTALNRLIAVKFKDRLAFFEIISDESLFFVAAEEFKVEFVAGSINVDIKEQFAASTFNAVKSCCLFERKIRVVNAFAAHTFEFFGRNGINSVVFVDKLTRNGKHGRPAVGLFGEGTLPRSQPSDNEVTTFGIFHHCGCVEVETVIEREEIAAIEYALIVIKGTDHVTCLVNVVEHVAFVRNVLRRSNHYVLVAEMRKARAFPHGAFGVIGFGNGDDRFKRPIEEVIGLKQNDLRTRAVTNSVTDYAIIFAVVIPDFRIAEVDVGDNRGIVRNVNDGVFLLLREVNTVFGISKALTFGDIAAACTAGRIVAGRICCGRIDAALAVEPLRRVHKPELAFKLVTATAEAAIPVVPFVTFGKCAGRNGYRLMFPMAEILTCGMPPVHGTPVHGIRMILIENVILAFVVRKAVRIIEPTDRRRDVILGIPL